MQKLKRCGRTAYAAPEFPRDLLIRLTDCPDLPLRMGPAETIKAGNTALVLRARLPWQQGMVSVSYKRVVRKTPFKRFSQAFGHNPTLRSYRIGQRLVEYDIPTAKPLAVIVPALLQGSEPSWLINEWIEGAENLASFVTTLRHQPNQLRRPAERALATAVGALLGKMHARGISHRDLKPQNLLVRYDIHSQLAEAYVIDLDGAQIQRTVSDAVRWKNLSRLAVALLPLPNEINNRFLMAYLAASGSPVGWKRAWREVEFATDLRRSRRKAA